MEYIRLGLSDLHVSRVGFGCWAIGGHGYGRISDEESIKAIHKAVDLGINLFDTADVYGLGHSEEILGRALDSHKKYSIIATKFGLGWDHRGRIYEDCSPKSIIKALEGSLRRLKIDCVPLYQIHRHDGITPIPDIISTLLKLKDEGKIRYIGSCNFSLELIAEALKSGRLESLQTKYNIVARENEVTIRDCSKEYRVGILAYGVLERGLFSGKYNAQSTFGESDTRRTDPNFRDKRLSDHLRIVKVLKDLGRRYRKTPSQLAIRLALENEHVSSSLIGIKSSHQIEENIGALGWELPADDLISIRKMIEVTNCDELQQ